MSCWHSPYTTTAILSLVLLVSLHLLPSQDGHQQHRMDSQLTEGPAAPPHEVVNVFVTPTSPGGAATPGALKDRNLIDETATKQPTTTTRPAVPTKISARRFFLTCSQGSFKLVTPETLGLQTHLHCTKFAKIFPFLVLRNGRMWYPPQGNGSKARNPAVKTIFKTEIGKSTTVTIRPATGENFVEVRKNTEGAKRSRNVVHLVHYIREYFHYNVMHSVFRVMAMFHQVWLLRHQLDQSSSKAVDIRFVLITSASKEAGLKGGIGFYEELLVALSPVTDETDDFIAPPIALVWQTPCDDKAIGQQSSESDWRSHREKENVLFASAPTCGAPVFENCVVGNQGIPFSKAKASDEQKASAALFALRFRERWSHPKTRKDSESSNAAIGTQKRDPIIITLVNRRRSRSITNLDQLRLSFLLNASTFSPNRSVVCNIVFLEDISTLEQQAHVFSQSDALVAVHGAALAFAMVMPPTAVIIEVLPPDWQDKIGLSSSQSVFALRN